MAFFHGFPVTLYYILLILYVCTLYIVYFWVNNFSILGCVGTLGRRQYVKRHIGNLTVNQNDSFADTRGSLTWFRLGIQEDKRQSINVIVPQ